MTAISQSVLLIKAPGILPERSIFPFFVKSSGVKLVTSRMTTLIKRNVRLKLVEAGGADRFSSITEAMLKDANGVFLLASAKSNSSWDYLNMWTKRILMLNQEARAKNPIQVVYVCLDCDAKDEEIEVKDWSNRLKEYDDCADKNSFSNNVTVAIGDWKSLKRRIESRDIPSDVLPKSELLKLFCDNAMCAFLIIQSRRPSQRSSYNMKNINMNIASFVFNEGVLHDWSERDVYLNVMYDTMARLLHANSTTKHANKDGGSCVIQ
jgi:GTPase SAR1 family protein